MVAITYYVGCIAFAIAPLAICIRLRDIVRAHRAGIVDELAKFFDVTPNDSTQIVQSFEFVKFKYKDQDDFRGMDWFVSSLFLIALLLGLNLFSALIVGETAGIRGLPDPFGFGPILAQHRPWGWSFLAAYCGAYVFLARALLQAINNFDLTPGSLYGALVNIFMGITMPQIVYFGFSQLKLGIAPIDHVAIGASIVTSFIAGFMPETILRETFRRTNLSSFKRLNSAIYDRFVSTPIEVIDGIDSEIRDRLKDFHIVTLQNLAVMNPILLFVETPYGIYQLIDWVAQAQLCASVGPDSLTKFWALGIRTIFDLEQVANADGGPNSILLKEAGRILLAEEVGIATPTDDDIRANIRMRVSNVHVHRLRQIVILIGDRLGEANLTLPPLIICKHRCRFADASAPGATSRAA